MNLCDNNTFYCSVIFPKLMFNRISKTKFRDVNSTGFTCDTRLTLIHDSDRMEIVMQVLGFGLFFRIKGDKSNNNDGGINEAA